jgi:hypothetical protein
MPKSNKGYGSFFFSFSKSNTSRTTSIPLDACLKWGQKKDDTPLLWESVLRVEI